MNGVRWITLLVMLFALSAQAFAATCSTDFSISITDGDSHEENGPDFDIKLVDATGPGFPPTYWDGYLNATLNVAPASLDVFTSLAQTISDTGTDNLLWNVNGSSPVSSYDVNITLDNGSGTCYVNKSFEIIVPPPQPNVSIEIDASSIPARLIIGNAYNLSVQTNNTGNQNVTDIDGTVRDSQSRLSFTEDNLNLSINAGDSVTRLYEYTPQSGGNSTILSSINFYNTDDGDKVTFGDADFYVTTNNVSIYVNKPPVFAGSDIDADIDFSEETTTKFISDLTQYIRDGNVGDDILGIEDSKSNLTWSYINGTTAANLSNLDVLFDNDKDELLIYSPDGLPGEKQITLVVTDTDGVSVQKEVYISVGGVNDAPIITCNNSYLDQTKDEDSASWDLDLSSCKSDEEDTNPSLIRVAEPQDVNESLITTSVSGDIITFTPVANASGTDTITLVLNDSEGKSGTKDMTVTINPVNDEPVIEFIADQTINENDSIDITGLVNASDIDSGAPTISYSSTAKKTNASLNDGSWTTSYNDSGKYLITVTASDGSLTTERSFDLTVTNVPQGPEDTTNGQPSDVTTTFEGLDFRFNGTLYTGQTLMGSMPVDIRDNVTNETVVSFDWTFANTTPFDFNSIVIPSTLESGDQAIVVKGIDLSGFGATKTVYLNKTNTALNYVCIRDAEIDFASEILTTSDCSGSGETRVQCSGSNGAYSCTDLGSRLQISGLTHSGVIQLDYTPPASNNNNNPGGGGGGGGSSGSRTTVCTASWACTSWSPTACPASGKQTRTCVDQNSCGTSAGKPNEERTCFHASASTDDEEPQDSQEQESSEDTTQNQDSEEETQVPDVIGRVVQEDIEGSNKLLSYGILSGLVLAGIVIYNIYFRARPPKPPRKIKYKFNFK